MARTLENMDDTLIACPPYGRTSQRLRKPGSAVQRNHSSAITNFETCASPLLQLAKRGDGETTEGIARSGETRANLTATLANVRCRIDGVVAAIAEAGHSRSLIEKRATLETAAAGQRRSAAFEGEALTGALFAERQPVAAGRSWLVDRRGEPLAPKARLRLPTGRPDAEARDRGPTVCACFDVGRNEILERRRKAAAVSQGSTNV